MSSDSYYYNLKIKNVAASLEDAVSSFCFDHGAQGVSEELDFKQTSSVYLPEVQEKEVLTLDAYFTEAPRENFLLELQARFPNVQATFQKEAEKDWLAEWKKGFEPFQLVGPYWIVPPWCEKPEEVEKPIWMEPGMAFGTGTHETTQLASAFIGELYQTAQPKTVLDVGTGTGILAFLTQFMGATRVVGLEIDEPARQVARENAILNKCEGIEFPDEPVQMQEEKYELVIANIIDGVLLQLKPDLLRTMGDGAYLILTGILEEREAEFLPQFIENSRLKIVERKQKGEWLGFLLR